MSSKTKSDSIEALKKKAGNNDAVAMYHLAELLSESNNGITPDLDKVINYLEKASDSGYKPASYKMYRLLSGMETATKMEYFEFDDSIDADEKLEISVDYEKAIEYLSLVTKSDVLKDNAITTLDDEHKDIIKGKLAWSDEYSTGKLLPKDIKKAVALAISIIQNLEYHISTHLENINHLNIEEVSKKQEDTNDYLSALMKKLLEILLLGFRKDKCLVSREIIDKCMMMSAKLNILHDIRSQKVEEVDVLRHEQSRRYHAFYDFPTRFNPDGNKEYVPMNVNLPEDKEEDANSSYIIDLEKAVPYKAYMAQYKHQKFGPRQIENAILKADSISLFLESKEILDLKDEYLDRYIPSLEFAYHYCLLLMLAHQKKEALNIYTNVIDSHKMYRKTVSKRTIDLVKKFKELVNSKQAMTFDDYKQNIYAETLAKDPCYLYEQEKSNGNFNQKYYEMCKFPKLKKCKDLFSGYLGGTFGIRGISHEDNSIFDIVYDPRFAIRKETLQYIKTLYKGGQFNGFYIEKNISKSMNLSKRAAKYIVKSHNNDSLRAYKNNSLSDKNKKIRIKFILNHIKLARLNGKSVSDRYYSTLVSLGRSADYQSDYQVLSEALYKRKNYLENPRKVMQSFKAMTSGMDYYYGTEDDDQARCEYGFGYDNVKWRVYPLKYDARKKFSAWFVKNMKSLDQLAREENNPFKAFLCIQLLMLADQWKNNNKDVIRWLASDHFRALEVENGGGIPFQGIEKEEDDNIRSILSSLKNNEKNIDFSKAIDIDGYTVYSEKVDIYISIATDGFVKIPEILFMRALFYLNHVVDYPSCHNSRLVRLTTKFYDRNLVMTEILSQKMVVNIDESYTVENKSNLVSYPFLDSLDKCSAYVNPDNNSDINSRNISKSLRYINDILSKNDKDEMVYACHPSLIQDAIALKIELEKELHSQQVAEINERKTELEVQKAKQKAASEKEREMLSFLTHTLRNSLANGPAQLKQSIRLLGTDDYDESNSKYKAINNIVSQLSTFSVVNTLITTFKQYVEDQESFLAQWYEDKQGEADINWVVSFCLRQCISRALFFPNYQRVIKRLIKNDSAAYIKKTRKNYIENILSLNDDDSPSEKISGWMETYLPKLEVNIEENSPEFAVNNIKYTYLFSIFSEVIWNAFKHTDGEHPISVHWVYNKDHYLFTVENHYIEDEVNLESSTNKGLIFIERLLSMFDNASLIYLKDESNTFVASIKLPDNIFS